MTLGLAFWIIMLVWLFAGLWSGFHVGWPVAIGNLAPFLLFLILGWHAFGPPVR